MLRTDTVGQYSGSWPPGDGSAYSTGAEVVKGAECFNSSGARNFAGYPSIQTVDANYSVDGELPSGSSTAECRAVAGSGPLPAGGVTVVADNYCNGGVS